MVLPTLTTISHRFVGITIRSLLITVDPHRDATTGMTNQRVGRVSTIPQTSHLYSRIVVIIHYLLPLCNGPKSLVSMKCLPGLDDGFTVASLRRALCTPGRGFGIRRPALLRASARRRRA